LAWLGLARSLVRAVDSTNQAICEEIDSRRMEGELHAERREP
jgi:hypothetical protein